MSRLSDGLGWNRFSPIGGVDRVDVRAHRGDAGGDDLAAHGFLPGFTSFSRSGRMRRVSADTSSMVRNTASMSAVWTAPALHRFQPFLDALRPLHRLLGVGEVLVGLQVAIDRAQHAHGAGLEFGGFEKVTMPVTSTRNAGSWSGALPVGAGAADGSGW